MPAPRGGRAALLFLFLPATVFLPARAAAQGPPGPSTGNPKTPAAESQDKQREVEEEGADNVRARERWFYERRASSLGFIPGAARLEALKHVEVMRQKERAQGAKGPERAKIHTISSLVWTPIGPRPTNSNSTTGLVSGRVAAIAVNPLNRDEVYVGGAQGGVWRSVDGGANWTPLIDGDPAANEPSLAIGSIAIDGNTCSATSAPVCQTIYVGTGEQTFSGSSYFGAGILKTTDGGANWVQLGTPPGSPFVGPFSIAVGGARIGSLAIRPGTSGPTTELLAGVQILINADSGVASGVYRSTDAGATWTLISTASGASGNEVLFDPANPSIAYAALGVPSRPGPVSDPEAGIYRSTDGGATFAKILTLPAPVTSTNIGRVELSIGQGVLYASIADASTGSDSLLGVFKSVNGGTNWTHLSGAPSHCNPQCWYDHVIKVHPNNGSVVYIGGSAIGGQYFSRTIDGGGPTGASSWQGAPCNGSGACLHVDIQSMAIGVSGGSARLYVGNDGGVWSADVTDPVALLPLNWVNLNAGLELTQFYPSPSIHPTDIHLGFGGTQDNQVQRYTGSQVWNAVTCGDGGWTIIDPVTPNNIYATCQNIALRKSTTGGGSFSAFFSAGVGIDTSDDVSFIPPFVMDPNNPARLYFGTCRVWQTINSAGSWQFISPDLSEAASGFSCLSNFGTIETISVAPSDSNIVYAGTSDGRIQRTTNALAGAGAVWTDITGTGLSSDPATQRSISWIAVHPTAPDTVYVGLSGFSGLFPSGNDTTGHVFRATMISGAATVWTDISSTLPNIPVNTILIDPLEPNTVYVATDVGVFFATDANTASPNWTTLMTGLPRVAVMGLALHNATRTLRAATHGRGMWDLSLNPPKKRRGQVITSGLDPLM